VKLMWSMNRVAISHRLSRAPWARSLLSTHSHRCSHLGLIRRSHVLPFSSCSPFSSCVGLFSLNVGLFLSHVGLFCMGHYSATLVCSLGLLLLGDSFAQVSFVGLSSLCVGLYLSSAGLFSFRVGLFCMGHLSTILTLSLGSLGVLCSFAQELLVRSLVITCGSYIGLLSLYVGRMCISSFVITCRSHL